MMTSPMTSQYDDKVGPLQSCLIEIVTFFAITLKNTLRYDHETVCVGVPWSCD